MKKCEREYGKLCKVLIVLYNGLIDSIMRLIVAEIDNSFVFIYMLGFGGVSYGELIPVNSFISPARAFLYSLFSSRCSQTFKGVLK